MGTRIFLLAVCAMLAFRQQAVEASPLTYDFTGTFAQPLFGSTQFSGSFTINGNPTVIPPLSLPDVWAPPFVNDTGCDVSITVNMGGQVFKFDNNAQDDTKAGLIVEPVAPPYGSGIEFSVTGWDSSGPSLATFGLHFFDYDPSAISHAAEILGNFRSPVDTTT